jgi:flagellar basal-body rod protein FlgG
MIRALYTSASGMQAQQANLDNISNNLANVNTTGYKKSKIEFQDLLYQTDRAAGAQQGQGAQTPGAIQIGHGSRISSTSRIFSAGELTKSGEKLDIAINGDGFFEVQLPDGTRGYSRDGALKLDNQGRFVTSDGYQVLGGFQAVPQGTTDIAFGQNGDVTMRNANGSQTTFSVQLVRFANPGGLESVGGNIYKSTDASGAATPGIPGQDGLGTLQQGYLEMSNVKVVEEMVNMIVAQRAYEVNSKAVQASDEMMKQANNLR